jgi:hypothetical protein
MADTKRRDRATGTAFAVLLVLVGSAFVSCASEDGRQADGDDATATTTTEAQTEYGCAVNDLGSSVAPEARSVDPSCTEPAILAEFCNLSRSQIVSPGVDGTVPGASVRSYDHLAGGTAGTIVFYTSSSGPPGIAVSAQCPDGSAFNFTQQDWESFNAPA